jgi:hypothetical protein
LARLIHYALPWVLCSSFDRRRSGVIIIFLTLPVAEQTCESFQQKLRARFARGEENIIIRRLQLTFRVVRNDPPLIFCSRWGVQCAFTRNQVKVKNQGVQDTLMECIQDAWNVFASVFLITLRYYNSNSPLTTLFSPSPPINKH